MAHDPKNDVTAEERKADVTTLYKAWNNPGPQPEYHREAQRRLRRNWPVLARALDALPSAQVADPVHRPSPAENGTPDA